MPSQARLNFENNLLKDVHELLDIHKQKHKGKRGKPKSVYTRSGVFLLCAAWELYVEDAALAILEHVLSRSSHPDKLPKRVQETVAAAVREREEIFALQMAGDGWKSFCRKIVEERVSALNSPTAPKVGAIYKECLGIEVGPILGPETKRLKEFVAKRGAIAHQGVKAGFVGIGDLESDYKYICNLVEKFDNALVDIVRDSSGARPWNKRG